MATRSGVYADDLDIPTGYNSGPPVKPAHAGVYEVLGDVQGSFLMVALNSLSAVVHWTMPFADWSATGWTGGNTPLTNVSVLARRRI